MHKILLSFTLCSLLFHPSNVRALMDEREIAMDEKCRKRDGKVCFELSSYYYEVGRKGDALMFAQYSCSLGYKQGCDFHQSLNAEKMAYEQQQNNHIQQMNMLNQQRRNTAGQTMLNPFQPPTEKKEKVKCHTKYNPHFKTSETICD